MGGAGRGRGWAWAWAGLGVDRGGNRRAGMAHDGRRSEKNCTKLGDSGGQLESMYIYNRARTAVGTRRGGRAPCNSLGSAPCNRGFWAATKVLDVRAWHQVQLRGSGGVGGHGPRHRRPVGAELGPREAAVPAATAGGDSGVGTRAEGGGACVPGAACRGEEEHALFSTIDTMHSAASTAPPTLLCYACRDEKEWQDFSRNQQKKAVRWRKWGACASGGSRGGGFWDGSGGRLRPGLWLFASPCLGSFSVAIKRCHELFQMAGAARLGRLPRWIPARSRRRHDARWIPRF